MAWRWTPTAVLTLAGAAFFLVTAAYVWRMRGRSSSSAAATSLVLLLLATTQWSLAYIVELTATDLATKEFWGDLKYVGILALCPTWFAFTFHYAGRGRLVNRHTIALLLIHPALVLALLINPELHDLFRYYPPGADPGSAAAAGPLYWPHLAYTSLVLWVSSGVLITALSRVSRLYRRQAVILTVGVVLPFVANFLYSFEVVAIDLSPFAFTLACFVLVWGVFSLRLLDLAPLARGSLFEMMRDPVLALDAHQRIADLNPAASELLGVRRSAAVGRPVEQLLPDLGRLRGAGGDADHPADHPADQPADRPADRTGGEPVDGELVLRQGDATRVWELNASALRGPDGRPTGWLLVLRDVTKRRRAEERLRQMDEARRSLLARVVDAQEQERRRIASDIHDDSIQAMAAAVMRLQLVRKRSRDADQLEKIDALEAALSQAIERLRHLLFHLRPPVLDELGLAAALRQYLAYSKAEDGWEVRVEDDSETQLPTEVRVTAYRIAQEAISNARRHAKARNLLVRIQDVDDGVQVRVCDDGLGFDTTDHGRLDPRPGHLGIAGMRERASMAGGWWRLDSAAGQGTVVEFWLPVADDPDPDAPPGPASALWAAADGRRPPVAASGADVARP
jgi:signal transduction histidine kinase